MRQGRVAVDDRRAAHRELETESIRAESRRRSRCGGRTLGTGSEESGVCVGLGGVKLWANALGQARNLHIV